MTIAAAMANIARGVSASIGVGYVAGVAKWSGTATLDDGGSIQTPGTPEEHDCDVQVDGVTEAMRNDAEYRDKDMRLTVLRDGLAREIDTDAKIEVSTGPHAGTWQAIKVFGDGAGIYFDVMGRRA